MTTPARRHIILASDHNGVRQASIVLWSIAEVYKAEKTSFINVSILCMSDVAADDCEQLRRVVERTPNVKLMFLNAMPVLEEARYKLEGCRGYWPIAAFARCFLDILLPDEHGNVLYMDIDTFMVEKVDELLNLNLGNHIFAAVAEADFNSSNGRYERLCFDENIKFYFNSGIIIINLDNYRKAGGSREAMTIAENLGSRRIVTADQDILNYMGRNRVLAIHPRWNYNDGLLVKQFRFTASQRYRGNSGRNILEAILSPGIIHYSGKNKPWYFSHRPERKRYIGAMQKLGYDTKGLKGASLAQRIQLCMWDFIHCILYVIAKSRLIIRI